MKPSPFSGLNLIEATQPTQRDQRLFDRQPEPQPPVPPPAPETSARPPHAGRREVQAEPAAKQEPELESLTRPLDLAEAPLFRNTYAFTAEELEAIEDLRLELRRDLDTKVNKNDLVRSALHLLIENYRSDPAKSYVRKKIAKQANR